MDKSRFVIVQIGDEAAPLMFFKANPYMFCNDREQAVEFRRVDDAEKVVAIWPEMIRRASHIATFDPATGELTYARPIVAVDVAVPETPDAAPSNRELAEAMADSVVRVRPGRE